MEILQLTYEMAMGKAKVPMWLVDAASKGEVNIFVTDKIHGSQYAMVNGVACGKDDYLKYENGEVSVLKGTLTKEQSERIWNNIQNKLKNS